MWALQSLDTYDYTLGYVHNFVGYLKYICHTKRHWRNWLAEEGGDNGVNLFPAIFVWNILSRIKLHLRQIAYIIQFQNLKI